MQVQEGCCYFEEQTACCFQASAPVTLESLRHTHTRRHCHSSHVPVRQVMTCEIVSQSAEKKRVRVHVYTCPHLQPFPPPLNTRSLLPSCFVLMQTLRSTKRTRVASAFFLCSSCETSSLVGPRAKLDTFQRCTPSVPPHACHTNNVCMSVSL